LSGNGAAYDAEVRREIDEKLGSLCHVEYEGGVESLEADVAAMPRVELERLLVLAVVEIMESRAEAEREIARYVRRMNKPQPA
jgi:hypothetical protein